MKYSRKIYKARNNPAPIITSPMLVTKIGIILIPLTGGGGVGVAVKSVSSISVGSGVGDRFPVGVKVNDPVTVVLGVTDPDGVAVAASTCSPLFIIVKLLSIVTS